MAQDTGFRGGQTDIEATANLMTFYFNSKLKRYPKIYLKSFYVLNQDSQNIFWIKYDFKGVLTNKMGLFGNSANN